MKRKCANTNTHIICILFLCIVFFKKRWNWIDELKFQLRMQTSGRKNHNRVSSAWRNVHVVSCLNMKTLLLQLCLLFLFLFVFLVTKKKNKHTYFIARLISQKKSVQVINPILMFHVLYWRMVTNSFSNEIQGDFNQRNEVRNRNLAWNKSHHGWYCRLDTLDIRSNDGSRIWRK